MVPEVACVSGHEAGDSGGYGIRRVRIAEAFLMSEATSDEGMHIVTLDGVGPRVRTYSLAVSICISAPGR
jgi:hypothetical protein